MKMDAREVLNLFDRGLEKPTDSFWYQLYEMNSHSVRRYIFGWAVLTYCRENSISSEELPDRAKEIFEGIHAKDAEWHEKNNFWVVFEPEKIEPFTKTRQVLDTDWHRSWREIKTSRFAFPKIYRNN